MNPSILSSVPAVPSDGSDHALFLVWLVPRACLSNLALCSRWHIYLSAAICDLHFSDPTFH